jgi:hypothetical protein
MAKVVMLTTRAGHGFVHDIGETVDLPDDEAHRLIRAGQAELVRDQPKRERAVKPTPAMRRRTVADDRNDTTDHTA